VKIASAIVLALVAVGFALWWTYVRAPGPAVVCDHIVDVMVRESEAEGMSRESQAAIIEQMTRQCVSHKVDKIELRGRIHYAEYAKCVLSNDTSAAIERC
jgi:hypothetical protein